MTDFIAKTMKVKLEFYEPLLGSQPMNKELFTDFIASKNEDATQAKEEVENYRISDEVEKKTNGFLINEDGEPYILNYVIKGFFKAACMNIRRITGKKYKSHSVSMYQKKIKHLINIYPREIMIKLPENEDLDTYQRPCRANTPQGERISLKSSEMAPEGTTMEFEIAMMDESLEPAIREWLDYGQYCGLGEMRGNSFGAFMWQEITDN